jgi:hypothetical protein
MKMIVVLDGTAVPTLGQGSWIMAQDPIRRADGIGTLRSGIGLELRQIGTAAT